MFLTSFGTNEFFKKPPLNQDLQKPHLTSRFIKWLGICAITALQLQRGTTCTGTQSTLAGINAGRLKGWIQTKKRLQAQGRDVQHVEKYIDKNGKRRWKGKPQLRKSEWGTYLVRTLIQLNKWHVIFYQDCVVLRYNFGYDSRLDSSY